MLTLRPATLGDVPNLLSLLSVLGRPSPKTDTDTMHFRDVIARYIADDDKRVVVVDSDGLIVGFTSVMLLLRLNQKKKEMYMPELVVHKEYRSRGAGAMLVNFCVDLAREENCYRIRLESGNWRHNSHDFYKHLGFKQSALSFEMPVGDQEMADTSAP